MCLTVRRTSALTCFCGPSIHSTHVTGTCGRPGNQAGARQEIVYIYTLLLFKRLILPKDPRNGILLENGSTKES